MENNNKTQAELYREERKERLAKAAAKNAKRSPKSIKASKTAKKVISIVLAVVIALGAIAGVLNFFDIPQKAVKISIDGLNEKISLAEVNYYYFQGWSQVYSNTLQYDQYGEGMGLSMTGFDVTKTPDKQEYVEEGKNITGIAIEDLDVENPTWEDALTYLAFNQLIYIKYGAAKAVEAGIELSEDETKAIDDQIEEIRKTAKENDYSLDRFLRIQVGSGVTEKLIRELEINSQLATKFYEKNQEDTLTAVTADKINAEYAASKDNYDVVDLRAYSFAADLGSNHTHEEGEEHEAEHAEAEKKAKAQADEFVKKVTDDASFVQAAKAAILTADPKSEKDPDATTLVEGKYYTEIESNYGADAAKWVFDDARKVGDITVIEKDGTSFVLMMKTLPAKDTSVSSADVRHILVKFPDKNVDGSATSTTNESGQKVSTISDATKKQTKEKAQAILDEYLKNPTQDNFIALCKEKTDDTGSKETGGLIENIADNGQYVESFTKWSLDPARKANDVEIIESEYGYHIMYYVEAHEETWYVNVKNSLASKVIEDGIAKEIETITEGIDIESFLVEWSVGKENKNIANRILGSSSSHAGHSH